ncbi:hypothetical protein FIBSPDRAFT_894989 [Athelia psychrophila]|uniref:Uncharacterized protein n=1 Tax=Athelia psychrophila TaxID=1759441 RepID=A0A166F966_9AGAM|nr:hypothetical protein FIBSPDRAFT_894989 [Fibularhizoctonia sp. CBS 109695]
MPTRRSNHWDNIMENPGSIFHQIMVLPTLAPHLARPEYLLPPGEGPLANGVAPVSQYFAAAAGPAPQLAVADENLTQQGSPALSVASDDMVMPNGVSPVPAPTFFLNVVLERITQMFTNRGPGKPKIVPDSKPGPKLPVLWFTLSCCEMVSHRNQTETRL